MAESEKGAFEDYDNIAVYKKSEEQALKASTKNFVVEFGLDEAAIAFDLDEERFKDILHNPRPSDRRPVRWINIWAPNLQEKQVKLLGEKYQFSRRLLGIILTEPKERKEVPHQDKHAFWGRFPKDDPEVGAKSLDESRASTSSQSSSFDHYTIADRMKNYHAIDYGIRFICIGANWMHREKHDSSETPTDDPLEGKQRRLYSWLILCNDNTVISLQENPGILNEEDLKSTRLNLLSVLKQLSEAKNNSTDPLSMQSVRQALESPDIDDRGSEGSSNLFYYLFDDWRAVYSTVEVFGKRLKSLTKKSYDLPDIEIIPKLHVLGSEIRQMQHVYEGYKNLVQRILEPPRTATNIGNGITTPRSRSTSRSLSATGPTLSAEKESHVVVARSALARFERLGDRLQLLILSQTKEFLDEKDALRNTYFNINAQKDSKATARLSRAATLLAKLSVLFLPVSLMTSYFSVQIDDLEHLYTAKQYWYAFAAIMSISVLALFFFSRLLMWFTEELDGIVKDCGRWFRRSITARIKKGRGVES
ncbi:hypothetical protein LOCC1_G000020 [Lachnellula occidentalis]|uniref:ADP-ribosylation factor n=1 Tax=Lachnellula occidentalis TaxID=215460 RepID=A0A8H8UKT9_9HELO|nr:hypothetical protein LOCC1_G000020 [Lachnellula occidentalis]